MNLDESITTIEEYDLREKISLLNEMIDHGAKIVFMLGNIPCDVKHLKFVDVHNIEYSYVRRHVIGVVKGTFSSACIFHVQM